MRADDALHLGDDVYDDLAVVAQRPQQLAPPVGELLVALDQELADHPLERLDERGIRDVALELVELAGDEVATALGERPV